MTSLEFYHTDREKKTIRSAAKWLVDIAVILSLGFLIAVMLCESQTVSGQSMYPTMTAGDKVLVNKLQYHLSDPQRLDVIIFRTQDNKLSVKRIVGLPGETVEIVDGSLYINGELLNDKRLPQEILLTGIASEPIYLEEEEYFVLGQNLSSSEDSRFSNVGNIKREQIEGKVWLRYAPLANIGFIN